MQVLGDPTRMAIFERLSRGPLAVVDIADGLPVTRSAVSQHLKVLKEAGLVTSRRAANRSLYRLEPKSVAELRDYFDRFWQESLAAFKQAAEQPGEKAMNSTVTQPIPPVRHTLVVEASRERAFDVFTRGLDTWWFRDHHIGKEPMQEAVMEPRQGGRVYERGIHGAECDWGRVLVWEPPARLVVSWQLNDWQFDPNPAHGSEYEVRFIAEGSKRTRVEFEHRNFERHGAGGQTMHDAVEEGWGKQLAAYADTAQAAP